METTAIKALELFWNGNVDHAWEVAQQDEGLNDGITKEQWISWASKVERSGNEEASFEVEIKDPEIARTIGQQMGGIKKIAALTGARHFADHGNGLSFKFKMCEEYNYFKAILDKSMDLYTVTFAKVNKWGDIENEKTTCGVYFDMIKNMFEEETSLYLSF